MFVRAPFLPTLSIIVAAAVLLLSWTDDSPCPEPPPSGPQTIDDVLAIVQQLGLHCRSDRINGVIGNRLMVSRSPLTWEGANLQLRRTPEDPWLGTVAVYRNVTGNTCRFLPETNDALPWGEFWLYGDRSLISSLTGQTHSD